MRGSYNGPVIVKGSPEKSLLWQKVSARIMPPAVYNQKLPDAQIEIIRQWIAGGALADHPAAVESRNRRAAGALREGSAADFPGALRGMPRSGKADGRSRPADDRRPWWQGSKNGPVIVEGFSERSVLVRNVASHTMPPPGAGQPLSEAEIRDAAAMDR